MTYKIVVEDMRCDNCARKIKEALMAKGNIAVSISVAKKEVTVDSDLSVEELYETIEAAGFTPTDCDLM